MDNRHLLASGPTGIEVGKAGNPFPSAAHDHLEVLDHARNTLMFIPE